MKLFKLLFTRLNITIYLLVLQITFFLGLTTYILIRFPLFYLLGSLLSGIVFLRLVRKDKPAAFKLTWVIVVLTFLPVGGLLYLLFGDKRPTRKIAKYIHEHALIAKYLDLDEAPNEVTSENCGRMSSLFQYIRNVSSYHAYKQTDVRYYTFSEQLFADLLVDLNQAQSFIFLEYFIIKEGVMWQQVLDILLQKVEAGVDVRLIVDDFGSMKRFTNRYIRKLRAKGIKIVRFNPLRPQLLMFMNNRDHRKIIVIDGHTAYNGGNNIADEYINVTQRFGVWKDTGIRLHGDAVWSFTLMFIEMWDIFCQKEARINDYEAYRVHHEAPAQGDGLILPYGDSPLDHEQLGENVYIDMLNQAQRYVYIFTPYLIISENMIYALQMAAKRGVDIKIVTPGIPDKKLVFRLTRSYYRFLLDAGVRIYEYTPGFMHAKSFVCDDKLAVVGTINLDYRSLYLHFECATLIYDANVIDQIKADAIETISVSQEVKIKKTKRSLFGRFVDAILHLFAPLM
ncbi:MAG: cardiolipin synthase [Defluviitaleaceae bacterium]|nr:cardiolipin synthase [Defluviitaleaceae bacterium]